MSVEVNYLAVLLAAVSSMAVGAIWYAKGVFGETWAKLAKVKLGDMGGTNVVAAMGLTFVLSLLTAYVLAHVSFLSNKFFGNSFFQDALSTAFWLWLGLVVTRMTTHYLFEQKPTKLIWLNIGNEFVTIMLMGLIIGWLHP
ncbi:MAG TPA: DUF1761 domain-containing protein [Candidatus Pristimantibacillus sp.]|nr:DUF1761 domain-containing protein [Candidatus Pristimantibacillus sp.]